MGLTMLRPSVRLNIRLAAAGALVACVAHLSRRKHRRGIIILPGRPTIT
jgi:hypothetical protein